MCVDWESQHLNSMRVFCKQIKIPVNKKGVKPRYTRKGALQKYHFHLDPIVLPLCVLQTEKRACRFGFLEFLLLDRLLIWIGLCLHHQHLMSCLWTSGGYVGPHHCQEIPHVSTSSALYIILLPLALEIIGPFVSVLFVKVIIWAAVHCYQILPDCWSAELDTPLPITSFWPHFSIIIHILHVAKC